VSSPYIWVLLGFVGFGWCLLVFRMLLHVHMHGFYLFRGLIQKSNVPCMHAEIFTYLKLLMEQKKLGILSDDTQLIAQMNEQQYEYLQPKTARERIHLKFWHPPRRHDDQLFALALACYASKKEEPIFFVAHAR